MMRLKQTKQPDEKIVARSTSRRVLLVAPVPPPYGGMALQAMLLQRLLRQDGFMADLMGHNQPFNSGLLFLGRVPGVRTILNTVRFCLRFWRNVKHADVVHILAANGLHFLLVVAPAVFLARLRGKPVILNYRAGDADKFFKTYGWIIGPFFHMAEVVTAPSGFLAGVIERHFQVPVLIVPNIVNFSLFRYRERLTFQPRILVTRHLEEIYGVESVLRAFQQVQKSFPSASLWIGGTGSQEPRLRQLVREWHLANVEFLGYVDHNSLPAIYDQCDILLNGSSVDNFPGSLMEASAAGLVVVSTNAGGIGFIYENGNNALLVEVGDWKGLASGVEQVLADQDLARRLASAGAEVCQQYDWQNVRRRLYAAYGFRQAEENPNSGSTRSHFVLTSEVTHMQGKRKL